MDEDIPRGDIRIGHTKASNHVGFVNGCPDCMRYHQPTNPMRNCVRCGADVYASAQDQPHLCADIEKRLVRRKRQVDAVVKILEQDILTMFDQGLEKTAEDIVFKLSNLGVTDDV